MIKNDGFSVVVGIDVGGSKKGFHAVALRAGRYLAKYADANPASIAAWCLDMGARCVGIDAPCRWSATGRMRNAERALASVRISSFATPRMEVAQRKAFYRWMLNGAALYRVMEKHYLLFNGSDMTNERICFETFPQAVACALAGRNVPAKEKGTNRRNLLVTAGIDISELTNIDTVDAALCALAAQYVLTGKIKTYGDDREGFIVVPALSETSRLTGNEQ